MQPDQDEEQQRVPDEQVVLEELYDENYEPSEAEILEYAKWLGMDTETEKELLWIARAGLKEPVPEGWKPCQAPSKEIYYFNFITGESIWDHPCDEHFRKLYAQQKACLEERRQQEAGQQQDGGQMHQHQQQSGSQQWQQAAEQQAKAPPLLLPNSHGVQHTDMEPLQLPLTSPSGTLSTIASATTASIVESPVGGLAQGTSSYQLDPAHQQDATSDRASLGVDGTTAAGSASMARRALASSGDGSSYMAVGGPAAAEGAHNWRAVAAAADQEERHKFRQHLEEERHMWEQHLQADLHAQHTALHEQHQQRLWGLRQDLQEQEQLAAGQLRAEQDARLAALRMELQATLKGLEQELQDAKHQHTAHMEQLHAQQHELEVRAASMLQQAQQRLSATALADGELSAARDKVAAAVQLEALTEATGHRSELLQVAMQQVDQEVAAEVAAYRANRRAQALQQLAGHLSEDTAAAAQQLEQQTAELQRLEAAVSDKAAVLQKLDEQVTAKRQQGQGLLHSLSAVERSGDAQLLADCRDHLSTLQQQLAQAERQLASADAALLDKRAAVAEAEEQLAAVRRDMSVCEPRLGSLKQQLQELEAGIRARETEQQQRQADLALATRRLHELRDEVGRRQSQLDSLEGLYSERQDSLRQTANELAKRRGELATLESSLSESLRRKADAEYQALEEQLRRTRKAAADAATELASRQAALTELSAQVSSKQVSLEGVEASLSAKTRELQEVLGQLQAAAAQEFQDAKKLLLDEEARLLESERRSMQHRVADQVENERRAALSAGRRRIERELATQLAEQQSASLHQQQKQVKKWLESGAAGLPWSSSVQGDSAPLASTVGGKDSHSDQPPSGLGVSALIGAWPAQQQQYRVAGPGSVQSMPDTNAAEAGNDDGHDEAAAGDVTATPVGGGSSGSRRRARSLSPVCGQRLLVAEQAAAGRPRPSERPSLAEQIGRMLLQSSQQQAPSVATTSSPAAAGQPAAPHSVPKHHQQQQYGQQPDPPAAAADADGGSIVAGLQAAANAVVSQLRTLADRSSASASGSSSRGQLDLPELTPLQQMPSAAQLAAYSALLHQAKAFVKQRRRDIQQRQEAVMAAQADWRAVLGALEEQQAQLQAGSAGGEGAAAGGGGVPPELAQAVQQLRQLKGVLQDQIHALNEETQQIKGLKARVHQLKASVELAQVHSPQQEQVDPTITTLSSLLASLSGLQHKQQQWQAQQQQQQQVYRGHSSVLMSPQPPPPAVPPAQALLGQQHHQVQRSSLSQLSPLDKVTAALQSALDAAVGGAGGVGVDTATATVTAAVPSTAASSSSRRSSLQPWPNGVSSGPGGSSSQQLPELSAEGSWGTLNKLREERGAAQQLMQQHSQWLQGFREQVAQVAALQPALATKLAALHHGSSNAPPPAARTSAVVRPRAASASASAPAAAEGGGAGSYGVRTAAASLSPALLPKLGQPLTVDLGGQQELVISVVRKGSSS